ncbi:MAG: hypothetical protein ACLR23_08550 [Clostridia bacterium]
MEGALAVIQNRLDSKGYTEAQAYLDGTDRIRVEIPGVKDANAAVEDIGKTAMLTFVGFDWDDIKNSSIMDKYYDLYVQGCHRCAERTGWGGRGVQRVGAADRG